MLMYERKLEFGWDGDNDLGPRMIQQILEGKKTATCAPLFSYTEEELADVFASKGEIGIPPNLGGGKEKFGRIRRGGFYEQISADLHQRIQATSSSTVRNRWKE